MRKQDAYEYADAFKKDGNPPWIHGLYLHWRELLAEPYKGVTNDGNVRGDLYKLEDDDVPIERIVRAANLVISKMTQEQKTHSHYHIDSPEWRTWSNPEFLLSPKGIRLDEINQDLREAVMGLLEASLSPEGYEKAVAAMRINGFLGEIIQVPTIMNEFSYNFAFFGSVSLESPWGFSFYGHHLCLNAFFYKRQMILSPWFTGAEPNIIDEGQFSGTQIMRREESLGLQLMQSLPEEFKSRAQIYRLMRDPAMPRGRWNHDDQRHLCGAYRDNRVVPYEGVHVSELPMELQDLVTQIASEYLLYLPEQARRRRLSQIRSWYHETYFCWIGGFNNDDPFYYRLQSPVVIIEFDHHSGVFLTNKEPKGFHIHTLLRMPNGGDYGMALRPQITGKNQNYEWVGGN
ncbi:hypothetical protein FOC1_g10002328 [Fusarium oxysporum f. sp. cubense race 1]|uniref:Uncharacterized protein n=1 Tax=Fusarium oxysporum f. sp. cubense (strain race 1) TaxID=1229664 RepID=N4UJ45_FUSC1|nr:hypothetical protein FOC1_g10002328 [Fusarium oxysporum f. sp. cubense race 1]